MKSFYQQFAFLVRKRREELKLSKYALAHKVDLTPTAITKIESGECSVLAHNCIAITKALRIHLTELRRILK